MSIKKIAYLILGVIVTGSFLVYAADHIDAPDVAGTATDITDYYAFESPSQSSNLVFAVNTQGLLSPSNTAAASFNSNSMIQVNIDNDGDLVEDLIMQVIFSDGTAYLYGPVSPSETGLSSGVEFDADRQLSVDITSYGQSPVIAAENGIRLFAGPRDDPFFFDFDQFNAILAGEASSFDAEGTDTFAGTNVQSLVIEVPKALLGGDGTLNTWAVTKSRTN